MEYTYERDGLRFVWHGGQYIDIFREDEETPFDNINVYRMDGTLIIERSTRGFQRRCNRYVNTGD